MRVGPNSQLNSFLEPQLLTLICELQVDSHLAPQTQIIGVIPKCCAQAICLLHNFFENDSKPENWKIESSFFIFLNDCDINCTWYSHFQWDSDWCKVHASWMQVVQVDSCELRVVFCQLSTLILRCELASYASCKLRWKSLLLSCREVGGEERHGGRAAAQNYTHCVHSQGSGKEVEQVLCLYSKIKHCA